MYFINCNKDTLFIYLPLTATSATIILFINRALGANNTATKI